MADMAIVRSMTTDDLSMVLAWRNHPTIRGVMLSVHEIGLEEHRAWFHQASNDPTRRLLIIEDEAGPFGYVHFSTVRDDGVSDWGFYACPNAPKGSGRRLGYAALRYAFETLRLHKVCGQALETNAASISLHTRLGFKREGVLRDQHCIDGVYHSLICFGMLSQEWQPDRDGTGVRI